MMVSTKGRYALRVMVDLTSTTRGLYPANISPNVRIFRAVLKHYGYSFSRFVDSLRGKAAIQVKPPKDIRGRYSATGGAARGLS